MDELSFENLENLTNNSNFIRGQQYFESGTVSNVIILDDNLASGKVTGSKTYQILIKKISRRYIASCTCPDDSDHFCKHSVAVILAIIDYFSNPDLSNGIVQRNKISEWVRYSSIFKFRLASAYYKLMALL